VKPTLKVYCAGSIVNAAIEINRLEICAPDVLIGTFVLFKFSSEDPRWLQTYDWKTYKLDPQIPRFGFALRLHHVKIRQSYLRHVLVIAEILAERGICGANIYTRRSD
jgi:uncharacterized protein Usg